MSREKPPALPVFGPIFRSIRFLLRLLGHLLLALWIGGFTFYSTAVIPVLHEQMDSIEAGAITQKVTNRLNVLGVIAIAGCWAMFLTSRSHGRLSGRRAGFFPLIVSSVLLVFLILLHHSMDQRLADVGLKGFYPFHRTYLLVSTVQWLANVALLAVSPGWTIDHERCQVFENEA